MNTTNYETLFSRNKGIISPEEQKVLQKTTIGIAGAGGVGGAQLIALARAGIGAFFIADPEVFSFTDRNRQYGAAESTTNCNKASIMAGTVQDINPACKLRVYEKGIHSGNVDEFVSGCDILVDAIEYFTLEEKIRFYRAAREQKKFVFTSPIVGYGATLLVFDPEQISFEEYFQIDRTGILDYKKYCPSLPDDYLGDAIYEKAIVRGECPIPSLSVSAFLSGALLAAEVLLFILEKRKPITVPAVSQLDLFRRSYAINRVV